MTVAGVIFMSVESQEIDILITGFWLRFSYIVVMIRVRVSGLGMDYVNDSPVM